MLAGGPFVSMLQLKADVPGCEEVPGKLVGSFSHGMIEKVNMLHGEALGVMNKPHILCISNLKVFLNCPENSLSLEGSFLPMLT